MASNRSEDGVRGGGDEEGGELDDYELWREMKTQVKLLREDMDTRGANYHVQWPMDPEWRAPVATQGDRSSAPADPSAPTNAFPNLPLRLGANRGYLDCDIHHAPLMTDDGMFMDSRFDGLSSARVI